jgi:hypothetical protein
MGYGSAAGLPLKTAAGIFRASAHTVRGHSSSFLRNLGIEIKPVRCKPAAYRQKRVKGAEASIERERKRTGKVCSLSRLTGKAVLPLSL